MRDHSSMDNIHRPRHIQVPHGFYFLTAHTLHDQHIFHDDQHKQILLNVLKHAIELHHATLYGYILWPNHYHILVGLTKPILPKFVNNIHAYSAKFANEVDNKVGRRVWFQYWDRYIRLEKSEIEFNKRISYILHNPVKHGWCKTFDDAITYPWSSLPQWVRGRGKDWLAEIWRLYPVKDWSEID